MSAPNYATEPSTNAKRLTSLRDIPLSYKGVFLDQFGVLHDGTTPYPGAIEGVQYLADRGMKLLIISNSSRRSSGALDNLERMGFPRDAFCGVITSGEVTHDALENRRTQFWQSRKKCIHLTWGARGAISLENLGIDVTLDPEDADCIIAHGTEALGTETTGTETIPTSLEKIKTVLTACAALRRQDENSSIPMIVANPDVVTVHGTELRTMPGTLAKWYQELGGEVHLMGKPASVIYQGALQMLDLPAENVLAIGDSLEHDIAGAMGAGVDSLFVGGGIHAVELDIDQQGKIKITGSVDEGEDETLLSEVCHRFGAHPQFYIDYFAL
ncbi:hypothetical protein Ndes2437B_g02211 [Nannochloris sp. 'desiccata']